MENHILSVRQFWPLLSHCLVQFVELYFFESFGPAGAARRPALLCSPTKHWASPSANRVSPFVKTRRDRTTSAAWCYYHQQLISSLRWWSASEMSPGSSISGDTHTPKSDPWCSFRLVCAVPLVFFKLFQPVCNGYIMNTEALRKLWSRQVSITPCCSQELVVVSSIWPTRAGSILVVKFFGTETNHLSQVSALKAEAPYTAHISRLASAAFWPFRNKNNKIWRK